MSSLAARLAREAFNNMPAGPTPYLDTKGRRIKKSDKGAVFTENSDGKRNSKPIAAFIKPLLGNRIKRNIDNKNVKTIPNKIRPSKKFLDLNNSNSNSNSNNNYNTKTTCQTCNATFNPGNERQCCPNWEHKSVKIYKSKMRK
tara:strand:+ start:1186 stop:1614 length:429 start_codon:yes stop_codon:yes gene_type:complete